VSKNFEGVSSIVMLIFGWYFDRHNYSKMVDLRTYYMVQIDSWCIFLLGTLMWLDVVPLFSTFLIFTAKLSWANKYQHNFQYFYLCKTF